MFMRETVNATVLDSACTKTVTERAWRDTYLESISNEEQSQIKTLPSGTNNILNRTQKSPPPKLQLSNSFQLLGLTTKIIK